MPITSWIWSLAYDKMARFCNSVGSTLWIPIPLWYRSDMSISGDEFGLKNRPCFEGPYRRSGTENVGLAEAEVGSDDEPYRSGEIRPDRWRCTWILYIGCIYFRYGYWTKFEVILFYLIVYKFKLNIQLFIYTLYSPEIFRFTDHSRQARFSIAQNSPIAIHIVHIHRKILLVPHNLFFQPFIFLGLWIEEDL